MKGDDYDKRRELHRKATEERQSKDSNQSSSRRTSKSSALDEESLRKLQTAGKGSEDSTVRIRASVDMKHPPFDADTSKPANVFTKQGKPATIVAIGTQKPSKEDLRLNLGEVVSPQVNAPKKMKLTQSALVKDRIYVESEPTVNHDAFSKLNDDGLSVLSSRKNQSMMSLKNNFFENFEPEPESKAESFSSSKYALEETEKSVKDQPNNAFRKKTNSGNFIRRLDTDAYTNELDKLEIQSVNQTPTQEIMDIMRLN